MGLLDDLDLPESGRKAVAGGFIGTTCGFLFGTVEAGKNSGLTTDWSKFGAKLRDPTLMRFFFRNQMTTTAQFGAFFAIYMGASCVLEDRGVDRYPAVAGGAVAGMAPFAPSRVFRRNLPWAVGLICMDIYSSMNK